LKFFFGTIYKAKVKSAMTILVIFYKYLLELKYRFSHKWFITGGKKGSLTYLKLNLNHNWKTKLKSPWFEEPKTSNDQDGLDLQRYRTQKNFKKCNIGTEMLDCTSIYESIIYLIFSLNMQIYLCFNARRKGLKLLLETAEVKEAFWFARNQNQCSVGY